MPDALILTWYYRSCAGTEPACGAPGADTATITQALNYDLVTNSWLTGFFHVSGRCWGNGYGAGGQAGSKSIDPSYWVRFQYRCVGTAFRGYWNAKPVQIPSCYPTNDQLGFPCSISLGLHDSSQVDILFERLTCSPYHANACARTAAPDTTPPPCSIEDGFLFDHYDVTAA